MRRVWVAKELCTGEDEAKSQEVESQLVKTPYMNETGGGRGGGGGGGVGGAGHTLNSKNQSPNATLNPSHYDT